ncbi:MAG: cobalt-precorrin-5B (C(1))-methyltransferase [SAR324 cluster bacterium]|nr:cobalt-precorrin-5B (C(1))-methyltransferase [SAR324 cluster bacterium]
MTRKPAGPLRRGWTTGACATAATKAAYTALLTGEFPDPVRITLPKGQTPEFALAREELGAGRASATIVKDAGDDPDVTHGAMIVSSVRNGPSGCGVVFEAGSGVGTVTKPGLPISPGEPAINPVPRELMRGVIREVAAAHGGSSDVVITLSIPNGEELAQQTWNPRLGIVGGLSILGTTGIVIPYSCSAWIHSIQRGIDVARATGLSHVAGCTGSTSEKAVQAHYGLPDEAMLDMGDFVGGLLKYFRQHPLHKLTLGGGFGKLTKLAQDHLDLHSGRSQVDFGWLAEQLRTLGASEALTTAAQNANTANEVLLLAHNAGLPLADAVATRAQAEARKILRKATVALEVLVVDRQGAIVGHAPFS